MATVMSPREYVPESVSPLRFDAPGAVTAMPSPTEIHHVHIYTDERHDQMVEFYCRLLNAEVVRARPGRVSFLTYGDHDHRIAIFKKKGWGGKPEAPVGVSHLAFAYASLGELVFVYKQMKAWGHVPHRVLNHGNSTSFDYFDPDGNEVEIMMDNYTPLETQDYKRHYQGTEDFGASSEGEYDFGKLVELYESGVPDTVLLDREEIKRLIQDGRL